MYQAIPSRQERARYFIGELGKVQSQLRKTLDKYEKGKTLDSLDKENDEKSARQAHEYFLKLSIILEDNNGSMEWETLLLGRVVRAKIIYRLLVVKKQEQENREVVLSDLLDRERCLKQAHRLYLATVMDP